VSVETRLTAMQATLRESLVEAALREAIPSSVLANVQWWASLSGLLNHRRDCLCGEGSA